MRSHIGELSNKIDSGKCSGRAGDDTSCCLGNIREARVNPTAKIGFLKKRGEQERFFGIAKLVLPLTPLPCEVSLSPRTLDFVDHMAHNPGSCL